MRNYKPHSVSGGLSLRACFGTLLHCSALHGAHRVRGQAAVAVKKPNKTCRQWSP